MKFFIILALIAVARADVFESLFRNEIDAAVDAIHGSDSLHISRRGLELEEEEHQLLVRELKTDIAATLSEKLDNVTNKIINSITTGKQNIMSLFTSFRQLVNDLKELGGKAKGHIAVEVQKLKAKLATLKNDHLSPAIQLVIDFIKAYFTKSYDSLVQYDEIADEVVSEVVVRALKRRGLVTDVVKGVWNGIVDKAKDILKEMLTGLHGKFKELGEFLIELSKAHIEAAKPHVDNIKQLAKEFIGHASEATLQTLNESLDFFRAYKGDLGDLWTQLKNAVATVKSHLTPRPPTY